MIIWVVTQEHENVEWEENSMAGKAKFRGKPIINKDLMKPGESLKEFFIRRYDYLVQDIDKIFTNSGFVVGQVVYMGDSAWIIGNVVDIDEEYISLEYWIPVYPETVGRFAGRLDDNGTEIYHGDIVNWTFSGFSGNFYDGSRVGVVKWSDEFLAFVIADGVDDDFSRRDLIYFGDACQSSEETKIIGTMYDNPELLEVE